MKKNISIAIVIMTVLITGCGNNEPAETATPTVIEDQVVDNESDIEEDTEPVDDTEPVEVVPETPVVTGRVNRDDYWEGDTFHLDDYAAALGYKHLEKAYGFTFQYKDFAGNVTSWAKVTVYGSSLWSAEITCRDVESGLRKEIDYGLYHSNGDDDRRTGYIEVDDEIYDGRAYAYINTIIDTFDYFAYEASDALDLDGLPYCWSGAVYEYVDP